VSVCAADGGAEDASRLRRAARGVRGGGVVGGFREGEHLECFRQERCEGGGQEEVVGRHGGKW
jgi:hypothetical protein